MATALGCEVEQKAEQHTLTLSQYDTIEPQPSFRLSNSVDYL